ncbi:MAG: T9SS type A sorting domain-containing protein [Sphingobacteriales bacterium JAD_PAG50586_3]|nr:MAG: T9SS type A sorting domain-containing protein [Sphingobacteriales bacterium JAD_PAG50586_3]
MKKVIITLVALVAGTGFVFGQVPPNATFESWVNSQTYEEPTSWSSLNVFSTVAPGFPITCEKSTDAHAGQYAAKLTTLAGDPDFSGFPQLGQVFPQDTFPGFMLLGNLGLGTLGVPYSQRPTSANFWYKYTSVGGDSAGVLISLTRWDNNTNQQVTVGKALSSINTTEPNYTLGNMTINYFDNGDPDTLSIIAFSSYRALAILGNQIPTQEPAPGSTLFIDDFSILTTAVDENSANKFDFKMYPNPVRDEVSILCTGHQFVNSPVVVELYDMTGRRVQSINVSQMMSRADVSGLVSGMYIYAVKTGNSLLRTGKFTVAK